MGKDTKFNPSEYKGKDVVSIKTSSIGIRALYKWSPELQKYLPKKDGNRYHAVVKLHGRQKEKYFERVDDAKRWRMLGGPNEITPEKKMLFGELLERYFFHIKGRINDSTLQTYSNHASHLKPFKNYQVDQISSQLIDQWLVKIKHPDYLAFQKNTRLSYHKEVALLRQVFSYYSEYVPEGDKFISPLKDRHTDDCIIDQKRFKEARLKSRTKHMTEEEVEKFLIQHRVMSAIKPSHYGFYCLAMFQLQTGARIGEACSLRWSDLNFENGTFMISKTVQWKRQKGSETYIQPYTKTGGARLAWITEPLKVVLKEWKSLSRKEGLIFSHDGIEPYSYRAIQYAFDQAFKGAGLKWSSTHILRHTFSTEFLSHTRDFISLASILGHANTRMTEHYAKTTGGMALESFKKYEAESSGKLDNVLSFKEAAG